MVQSWYGGWNIWVYTKSAWESHIVLLYEWLQNYFETKEPIIREWCKILQKARTANPSATTMLAVAQWLMSFFVKRVQSQGNSMLKTLVKCVTKTAEDSAKEATKRKQGQHILLKVGCSRSTLPCHLSERLHLRGWQTPGNHQRH